jgi:hypothetical protein
MNALKQRLALVALSPFVLLATLVALVGYAITTLTTPKVAHNVAVALDQSANAALHGDPDETISSRAGKARRACRPWGCILCGILDRIDTNHCASSIEEDRGVRA